MPNIISYLGKLKLKLQYKAITHSLEWVQFLKTDNTMGWQAEQMELSFIVGTKVKW